MSFVDHLEDLRWHIFRALIAIIIGVVIVFVKMDFFFNDVILGPTHNEFITYRVLCSLSHRLGMGNAMCLDQIKMKLVSLEMSTQFMMSFTVAFVGGFVIAFPFVFYEFWKFTRPALTEKERKRTSGVIFWVSFLFFLGVAFGYFLVAPYTVNFFASYTLSPVIENQFRLDDYIDNIVSLVLGTGIVFQLPLLVLFLSRIGVITPAFLRTYRKYAFMIILVVAAVITPPDVVSMAICTVPLLLLYEISIWISAKSIRDKEQKELQEWS